MRKSNVTCEKVRYTRKHMVRTVVLAELYRVLHK